MKKLIKYFYEKNGFARMKEMREAGFQTRHISAAVEQSIIEKIKPGLYKLIEYPFDENESLVTVCMANNKAIISLLSAAAFYELSTFIPSEIYIVLPKNTPRFNIAYPPVKIYYFGGLKYELGITEILTASGKIKIYSPEKTIVDLLRYKDKLGEDIALECLKTYMKSSERKINILSDIANKIGVYKKIEPYIKGAL